MRWKYRLVEKSKRIYVYAYSRENDELDGLIAYDIEKGETSIVRASKADVNNKWSQSKALEHFESVIKDNFPDEKYVCCG